MRWGPGQNDRYHLDFAHLEAKINIELDSPYHAASVIEDIVRDRRLRSMGWNVIRIEHDRVLREIDLIPYGIPVGLRHADI